MRSIKSIQYAKSIFLLLAISIFSTTLWAQTAPPIQWKKTLGGTQRDVPHAITNTHDGGYIIAGETHSKDIDVTGYHNSGDAWLVRLDSNSNVVWKKAYGGFYSEKASDIVATYDGGFVFVGSVESFQDGDVSGTYPDSCGQCTPGNVWLVKLSSAGNIVWKSNIGSSGIDRGISVVQASDSGFVFIGLAGKNDRDVSGIHTPTTLSDNWFVKTNKTGVIQWQKNIGGSGSDGGTEIKKSIDGGYVIVGSTNSSDGDVNKKYTDHDTWVIKTDAVGTIQWNKTYGGSKRILGRSIVSCVNGGYLVLSQTGSTDGDFSPKNGNGYVWALRLDDTGKIQWHKSFGGTGTATEDVAGCVQAPDSGFVIACTTASNDGDVTANKGAWDIWIVRINKNGTMQWQKSYGSTGSDVSAGITLARDGYVIVSGVDFGGGDIANHRGNTDWFVFKLKENFKPTSIEETIQNADIKVYPSPTTGVVYIDLPQGYEKAEVKVYDMMGKVLQVNATMHGVKRTVDLSRFSSGTYTIQVMYNGQQQSFKVINQQ